MNQQQQQQNPHAEVMKRLSQCESFKKINTDPEARVLSVIINNTLSPHMDLDKSAEFLKDLSEQLADFARIHREVNLESKFKL